MNKQRKSDLFDQLESEQSSERRKAAKQLGQQQISEAVPVLFQKMKDERRGVQEACCEAIVHIGGEESVRKAISLLAHQDPTIRNFGIHILEEIGEEAPDQICSLLKHDDPDLVIFACQILANIAYNPARTQLKSLLDHEDENVRDQAIQGLAKIGTEDCLEQLSKFLGASNTVLTFSAVQTIGTIGGERAEQILVDYLEECNDLIKPFLIEILGDMKAESAVDPLLQQLNSLEDRACTVALQVLVESFSSTLSQKSQEGLEAEVPDVFEQEIQEERLTGVTLFDLFDQLADMDSDLAVEVFRRVKDMDDPVIKVAAVRGMKQMNHPDVRKLLWELRDDHDTKVRNTAKNILDEMESEETSDS